MYIIKLLLYVCFRKKCFVSWVKCVFCLMVHTAWTPFQKFQQLICFTRVFTKQIKCLVKLVFLQKVNYKCSLYTCIWSTIGNNKCYLWMSFWSTLLIVKTLLLKDESFIKMKLWFQLPIRKPFCASGFLFVGMWACHALHS